MEDASEFADLLETLGFDPDLLSAMSQEPYAGSLPQDPERGWREVYDVVNGYAQDLDSPFDSVPVIEQGRVDVVQVLVRMFDSLGTTQLEFPVAQPAREMFAVNGKLALLGLFSLFRRRSLSVREALTLPADALASAYTDECSGVDVDVCSHAQLLDTQPPQKEATSWLEPVMWAFTPFRYEESLEMAFPEDVCADVVDVSRAKSIAKLALTVCRYSHAVRERCLGGGEGADAALFNEPNENDPASVQLRWRLRSFKTDNVRRWKDFCRSPAVRGITHETLRNDRQEEFLLFCDGLFAKLVCEIDGVAERSGVESDSTFDRCVPSVLTVYAVLGMSACAFAALRPASAQWVTTLRKVDPNLVNELPYDCLIALFNDAILARMIAQPVKPLVSSINLDTEAGRLEQTNVVDGLASEEHKQTYLMCKPELNKPIVLNFLRPEPQFPLSREQSMTPIRSAQLDALDAVGDEWRKSLPMSKAYALSQAVLVVPPPDDMSLGDMAITPGKPVSKAMADYWDDVKSTVVAVRRGWTRYLVNSTKNICGLRLVCKQWNEHFRPFSFQPHMELASVSETRSEVAGSAALFGGPPRHVLFQSKPYAVKVYLRRKVLRLHGEQTVEEWEYVSTMLAAVGLNALRITCETEPDCFGRTECFAVQQLPVRHAPRDKPFHRSSSSLDLSYSESLPSQSLYSLHLPSDWRARRQFADRAATGVPVWNRKFPKMSDDDEDFVPHCHLVKTSRGIGSHVLGSPRAAASASRSAEFPRSWHVHGGCKYQPCKPVAELQSLEYVVVPTKTSKSFCKSSSDPPRALRFRVEIGRAGDRCPDGIGLMKSRLDGGGTDHTTIMPFSDQERSSFKPYMSCTSSYFYVSSASMRAEAAALRQQRRRQRTEADRDARQRRKLDAEALHMPQTAVS